MINKIYPTAEAALAGLLADGITIMAGGFGGAGIPETLIHAIRAAGARQLTLISNNCGADGFGLGILLANDQIAKLIGSYVGENKEFVRRYLAGQIELELNPQGTLAERIRAGGAGIRAFYTRTGVGTVVSEGKPSAVFDGRTYIQESWLRADLSIVKAWKADPAGNLVYRKTARNFNPNMATAGRVTVAEVNEIVGLGELDPDNVHTPGIYVHRIVPATINSGRIEQRTVRPRETA
jgi:3-oxoacid CoA-transferase subunit A